MRTYMSKEYINNLVGKTFTSSDSELKQYDGLKVVEVIRELTEKFKNKSRRTRHAKNGRTFSYLFL